MEAALFRRIPLAMRGLLNIRVFSLLCVMLSGPATIMHAQTPAWSRGIQLMSMNMDECKRRARGALEASGYRVDGQGGSYAEDHHFAGAKDKYAAAIACNMTSNGYMWINIFVSTPDGPNAPNVAGAERVKLQGLMERPGTVSAGCGLGTRWDETEEGWTAIWTRRGNSNVFDVQSRKGSLLLTAVQTISITGNQVSIARTNVSDGNNCEMRGTIGQDGVTVTGTYTCKSGGPYSWKATIRCR